MSVLSNSSRATTKLIPNSRVQCVPSKYHPNNLFDPSSSQHLLSPAHKLFCFSIVKLNNSIYRHNFISSIQFDWCYVHKIILIKLFLLFFHFFFHFEYPTSYRFSTCAQLHPNHIWCC